MSSSRFYSFNEYVSGKVDANGFKDVSSNDEDLVRLTNFICRAFKASHCLLSSGQNDRNWYLSCVQSPEEDAGMMFTPKPSSQECLVIHDAQAHPKFSKNTLFVNAPYIRFFVSVELKVAGVDGPEIIGSLCIVDHIPHPFTAEDILNLTDVASQVASHISKKSSIVRRRVSGSGPRVPSVNRHFAENEADERGAHDDRGTGSYSSVSSSRNNSKRNSFEGDDLNGRSPAGSRPSTGDSSGGGRGPPQSRPMSADTNNPGAQWSQMGKINREPRNRWRGSDSATLESNSFREPKRGDNMLMDDSGERRRSSSSASLASRKYAIELSTASTSNSDSTGSGRSGGHPKAPPAGDHSNYSSRGQQSGPESLRASKVNVVVDFDEVASPQGYSEAVDGRSGPEIEREKSPNIIVPLPVERHELSPPARKAPITVNDLEDVVMDDVKPTPPATAPPTVTNRKSLSARAAEDRAATATVIGPKIASTSIRFRYSISGAFSTTGSISGAPPSSASSKANVSDRGSTNLRSISENGEEFGASSNFSPARNTSMSSSATEVTPDKSNSRTVTSYNHSLTRESVSNSSNGSHSSDDGSSSRNHIKVLLMEDSVLVQKVLTRLFQSHGCEVKVAKNGKLGLEMLKEEDFDITFVDFFMPIQDGVTTMNLFKRWLDEQRAKPGYTLGSIWNDQMILVGISDVASDGDKSIATYNDMHIFCSKPVDAELLKIILNARRNCDSFSACLTQIKQLSAELVKRKATIVTAMGSLPAVESHAHVNGKPQPKPMQQESKDKHPKSWWRKVTEFYKPSDSPNAKTAVPMPGVNSRSAASSTAPSGGAKAAPSTPAPVVKATAKGPPPNANYRLHMEAGPEGKRTRVLIMDDSLPVQKILAREFKLQNCDVKCAANGQIGLDYMKKEEFDVILVDFFMPVVDGLKTMKLFNTWITDGGDRPARGEDGKSKPIMNEDALIIGMSDSATPNDPNVFDDNNMHFFCMKPIAKDILHIIVKAVKKHESVDEMLIYIEQNCARIMKNAEKREQELKNPTVKTDGFGGGNRHSLSILNNRVMPS